MTKKQMIEEILNKVKSVDCNIVRVYGVTMGVGYDLNVSIEHDKGSFYFKAHATRASWALIGHLRPNNPQYQYTGSCDYYQEDVIKYWEHGEGLGEYLGRFKKLDLIHLYDTIVKGC